VLLLTGAGSALAAETDPGDDVSTALDAFKEEVIERFEQRIEHLEDVIERLEGQTGVWAEQMSALAEEGIEIYSSAITEVGEAATLREVVQAVRGANREFQAHARVRRLYAHVQNDIEKFTRRLGWLERAIDRAEAAGIDVSAAVGEADAAATDLAAAQTMLDAVDPSQTGDEVVDALRAAHGTAHRGQAHIRKGWAALFDALPPPENESAPE
jgi:hypothetical protein